MKKRIAKTIIGTEFLHSKKDCFFAPAASAQKMCDLMNEAKYRLKDGETWCVYDYDWSDEMYVMWRLSLRKGHLKAYEYRSEEI